MVAYKQIRRNVVSLDEFKKQFTNPLKSEVIATTSKDGWIKHLKCYCGFDIETTTYNENSYMYIWQFSYAIKLKNGSIITWVVLGRSWSEFSELLQFLRIRLRLDKKRKIIVWVANLGYEFQFIRKRIAVYNLFAKTNRNPLYFDSDGIEFRDCLAISGGNLSQLAKDYTHTQKLDGDLDYNIIRNSKTPLTQKEYMYCVNDVVILSEFSKVMFDTIIKTYRKIPLTKTSILRMELKQRCKNEFGKLENLHNRIMSLYPTTKEEYLYIMRWLFRGGYVHSNFYYTNETLHNLEGYDIKSSYPSRAFKSYYPITPFKEVEPTKSNLENYCKTHCVYFQATFYNIKATTKHSIESLSKCITYTLGKGGIKDNGRIMKAEKITVCITELDYIAYKNFYTWDRDSMEIEFIKIAHRGTLPKYLLDMFYHYYELKETIDKETKPKEYAIAKSKLNSLFGLCVTRLVFNDINYSTDKDKWTDPTPTRQTYESMIKKQLLSPFWGVWMTAHARYEELEILYKLHEYVVYCDTDSHKILSNDFTKKVVEDYNKKEKEKTKQICEKYGYSYSILEKIGIYEHEGHMTLFKTLGSKRYIYTDNKGFHTTVSGLKKSALLSYCKEKKKNPYNIFQDNLCIPSTNTEKLVTIYNDDFYSDIVTDEYGHSEFMEELSNTYLKPSDFNLGIDDMYLYLLMETIERKKKHEN